ncbi:hypothetical protein MSAN_02291200 [Mycena sanguinolenta]|uniref:Uncharacterized protein n=1 Tax=Mycena sanguinolenta TaxID=230812 RepID=A0A8H6X9R9_9AGAR|nr:hypothetical protein MSAN_02291200 [Mycena sanguinolenta]
MRRLHACPPLGCFWKFGGAHHMDAPTRCTLSVFSADQVIPNAYTAHRNAKSVRARWIAVLVATVRKGVGGNRRPAGDRARPQFTRTLPDGPTLKLHTRTTIMAPSKRRTATAPRGRARRMAAARMARAAARAALQARNAVSAAKAARPKDEEHPTTEDRARSEDDRMDCDTTSDSDCAMDSDPIEPPQSSGSSRMDTSPQRHAHGEPSTARMIHGSPGKAAEWGAFGRESDDTESDGEGGEGPVAASSDDE